MIHACIKCHKIWETLNGDLDPTPSGSLCELCLRECLIPLYRKRQLREGNFDCYGKAEYYCDQGECKYRKLCVKERQ
jgi:hypothetical protein